jgi:4-hydroxy-tetrahydrodipicolinate reductase
MKFALIGYGKMGKAVEAAALKRGHSVPVKADAPGPDAAALKDCDVAIEFTGPGSAVQNIRTCFQANIPVVVGTTGWYDQFDAVKAECEQQQQALLTATNFSIGVNLFFALNRQLALLMNKVEGYEVSMDEIHHIHKLDSPSGTALTLANDILAGHPHKTKWAEVEEGQQANEDTLAIRSHRIGETVGTHSVTYQSAADRIDIRHEAFTREGFALGAVLAAEWIIGKKGVFTMKEVLGIRS